MTVAAKAPRPLAIRKSATALPPAKSRLAYGTQQPKGFGMGSFMFRRVSGGIIAE